MQWDPDHMPDGDSHPYRRAVQLGLKNVPTFADGTDIIQISDITQFVHEQAARLKESKPKGKKKTEEDEEDANGLLVAKERVFVPISALARQMIEMAPPPGEARISEDDE
jgi:hypothetical protein